VNWLISNGAKNIDLLNLPYMSKLGRGRIYIPGSIN
jgi:hypothetical protein